MSKAKYNHPSVSIETLSGSVITCDFVTREDVEGTSKDASVIEFILCLLHSGMKALEGEVPVRAVLHARTPKHYGNYIKARFSIFKDEDGAWRVHNTAF